MSDESKFEYIRKVDTEALDSTPPTERFSQRLIDYSTGAKNCRVHVTRVPPGGHGVPKLHTHDEEQMFFVLAGKMALEVGGEHFELEVGNLGVCPPGVPHRWVAIGTEPMMQLTITAPPPKPKD